MITHQFLVERLCPHEAPPEGYEHRKQLVLDALPFPVWVFLPAVQGGNWPCGAIFDLTPEGIAEIEQIIKAKYNTEVVKPAVCKCMGRLIE